MLVYSSNLSLRPENGLDDIAGTIARWLGQKSRGFVSPERLLTGIDERLRDGSRVESISTKTEPLSYPLALAIKLSHPDDQVPGRQWSVEIGARQDLPGAAFHCSVLLQTSEISARVTAPIQPSCPRVVDELIRNCNPTPATTGLSIRHLDEHNARAFVQALEHSSRQVPWVIVSPSREGNYLVDVNRLRGLLVGIADVFEISSRANTFEIQDIIGSRYAAWLGAVNIIFPSRQSYGRAFYETVRFLPEQIQTLGAEWRAAENEIFSNVTHRTNLPNSWKHISASSISNIKLRSQLAASIRKAQESNEASEYLELLMEADRELKAKETELTSLQTEIETLEDENLKLESDVDSLKHALSGKQNATGNNSVVEGIVPLREAVIGALNDDISLEQSLNLVGVLFPERIIITQSAFDSAQESNEFKYGEKALDLMMKLATSYWTDLSSGKPDSDARKIFGNGYAAKESETLSIDGRKRRTFVVNGRPIEMLRHLKIGVKDSAAETLRIHFEWIPAEKKIVIGHCGKHLDF